MHSLSMEPMKVSSSKRKRSRSVSTLTPSQLGRKRAKDREAQRVLRTRTKEHIERLERELQDLRSTQSQDRTVQDLLRRNKALEDELRRFKKSKEVSMTSCPYPFPTAYAEEGCAAILNTKMSSLTSGGTDYIDDYSQAAQQYMLKPNCWVWASNLPLSVSSPSSSVNTNESVPVAAYIQTSGPDSKIGTNCTGIVDSKEVKLGFEGLPNMRLSQGYMHHPQQLQQQQQPHHHPQQHQDWNMYPGMYFNCSQNVIIS